jgi:multiple sugar transport system permease protein
VPSLKALIIINFIGEFIHASQSSHLILVMTFGGPAEATKVSGLYIFEKAYLLLQYGPAVTMAWCLGLLMLGFTTIQLRRLSKMEFKTTGRK